MDEKTDNSWGSVMNESANGDKPKNPTPQMTACICGHVYKAHLQGACLACATCTGYEEEESK